MSLFRVSNYTVSTITEPFTAILRGHKWTVAASKAVSSRGRTVYVHRYLFRLWREEERPIDCDCYIVFDARGKELGRGTFQHEALSMVP
jgi:hypothetical protein